MVTNLNRGSRQQRHADQSPESVLPRIATGRSSPLHSPHNRSSEQELVPLHSQNTAPHESENHRLLLSAGENDNSAGPTRSALLECFKSLRERSGLPCFKQDIELVKPSEYYSRFKKDKSMLDGLDETHTGHAIKDVLKMFFSTKDIENLETFKEDMVQSKEDLEKVGCMCDFIYTLKEPITDTVPIKRKEIFDAVNSLKHRYKMTTEESDPAKKATNFDKMSLIILNKSGLETAEKMWKIIEDNIFMVDDNDKPSLLGIGDVNENVMNNVGVFARSTLANAKDKKIPLMDFVIALKYTIGITIAKAQKEDQAEAEKTKAQKEIRTHHDRTTSPLI